MLPDDRDIVISHRGEISSKKPPDSEAILRDDHLNPRMIGNLCVLIAQRFVRDDRVKQVNPTHVIQGGMAYFVMIHEQIFPPDTCWGLMPESAESYAKR